MVRFLVLAIRGVKYTLKNLRLFPSCRMLAEHESSAGRNIELEPCHACRFIERIGRGEVLNLLVDIAETAEVGIIRAQHDAVDAVRGEDSVVAEALRGAEIENEYEVAAHECKHLVVVFLPKLADGLGLEVVTPAYKLDHGVVECVEEAVLQILTVDKIPLAACVFVTPAIAFSREVDPLGMAEFITHEVEVAPVDSGQCNEAYHLVERHPTGYICIGVAYHHVPVHLGVDKTEDNCLVANKRLIVAFDV